MFGGNFAPVNWQFCEGQLLQIAQFETLFFLIGTTYGGDGQQTFALPDLRGRIPVHQGSNLILGQTGGSETVLLNITDLPLHSHVLQGSSANADRRNPKGAFPAKPRDAAYAPTGTVTPMKSAFTSATGGSQLHDNMQPYLCVSFIIATTGIFPTQN